MAQLMPLPPTVSCFSKIQNGFTFLVPAHLGIRGQGAVKWVLLLYRSHEPRCQADSNGMTRLVMRIKAAGDTVESYICA